MLFTTNALSWLKVILQERFGHSFTLIQSTEALTLTLPASDTTITFDNLQKIFHQSRSDFPCEYWKPSVEGFNSPIEDCLAAPSERKLQTPLFKVHELGATIHYDILGLTYWMLTRLEEIGRTDLDGHQRFPATASHAYRHGYLERPIVDEWLNILGQVMKIVWPFLDLKKNVFSIKLSHDVDVPSRYAFHGFKGTVKAMARDFVFHRDPFGAMARPWFLLRSRRSIHPRDPLNTFNWIMKTSEENGLVSAFYFICGRTDEKKDAIYDVEMPQIRALLGEIHQRGHEIGLHPSYNTFNQPVEIIREAERLRRVCEEEGIAQDAWGGRMHYLRYDQAVTPRAWADAGMCYDSTLGYADSPGFRCGTCFEYPAYDVLTDSALSLRIRPLIAMDCTVIEKHYLGLGVSDSAYSKFNELKNRCRSVNGVFTLLWHNSSFETDKHFMLYERIVGS